MELRRRFSRKWIGSSALIYASFPEQAIIAKVKIKDVVEDDPIVIWSNWKDAIDCSEEEFHFYTKNTTTIYGILLEDIKEVGPFYISSMERKIDDDLRPPQSYFDLSNNSKWRYAIELSNLSMQAGI